jgi:hypothetical protein
MEVIFKQQREVVEQEQLERLERVDMARRGRQGNSEQQRSTWHMDGTALHMGA